MFQSLLFIAQAQARCCAADSLSMQPQPLTAAPDK
jgi:hypothetical protein